ncbi:MAG: YcgN family cysteine cluster protein, partial [Deltaproteobacteria bacterium]|nr:YcgN family cysteine cluster protein [Deltaproteobacteria bacterium]
MTVPDGRGKGFSFSGRRSPFSCRPVSFILAGTSIAAPPAGAVSRHLLRADIVERKSPPFWKSKPLELMSPEEWESICDRCGNCCLEKLEDRESGEVRVIPVACEYLDTATARCLVYADRTLVSGDCINLTPETLQEIDWLPETCAYRLLTEGRDLPWWHPLVSGDPRTVHDAGISVRDRVLPGRHIHP